MEEFVRRIKSTYTNGGDVLESTPTDFLVFDHEGIVGNGKYRGHTRLANARDSGIARNTVLMNDRQFSAVSVGELRFVAALMRIPHIDAAWLGANLLFAGMDALSFIPPGSEIISKDGAILVVAAQNQPCTGPGKVIAEHYPDLEHIKPNLFPKSAINRRGIVGYVKAAGTISPGNVILRIHSPAFYSVPKAK